MKNALTDRHTQTHTHTHTHTHIHTRARAHADNGTADCVLPTGRTVASATVNVGFPPRLYRKYEECMQSSSWAAACGEADALDGVALPTMLVDTTLDASASGNAVLSPDGKWLCVTFANMCYPCSLLNLHSVANPTYTYQ
jgi:hypothetical protein